MLDIMAITVGVASSSGNDWDNWRDGWGQIFVFLVLGFLALSCSVLSMWPQPIGNLVRHSTEGMTVDWPLWITIGAVYQVCVGVISSTSPAIQDQLKARKGSWAVLGPESLDMLGLILPMHSLLLGAITLAQTGLLPRQSHKMSTASVWMLWFSSAAALAALAAIPLTSKRWSSMEGDGWWQWVDLINTLNVIAVVASLFKFVPQILLNRQRRSTRGFSTLQIALDATCWLIYLGVEFATVGSPSSGSSLWCLNAIAIGGFVGDGCLLLQWWAYRGKASAVSRQQTVMDRKVGERTLLLV